VSILVRQPHGFEGLKKPHVGQPWPRVGWPAGIRGKVGFLGSPDRERRRAGSKYPIKGVRHLLRGQLVRTGGLFVRDARRGRCR
jgi:hypothetical protein